MRQAKQGLSFIHPALLDAACASGQQHHHRSVPSIFQDAQKQTTRQQVNVPRFAGPENVAWCFFYGLRMSGGANEWLSCVLSYLSLLTSPPSEASKTTGTTKPDFHTSMLIQLFLCLMYMLQLSTLIMIGVHKESPLGLRCPIERRRQEAGLEFRRGWCPSIENVRQVTRRGAFHVT